MKGFRFGSALGSFYILPGNGGWEATFGNASLGAFSCPEQAADHISRGDCPQLSDLDTATLEVPHEIAEWEIVHV
ncbi:hypothetical protein [Burkholderia ubonensis]|uniref:Uncharacterized protein n=1 Tax=Burkholderia ubonensis TaxID=101571 RepID=A0A107FJG2_9BURK|nr:hypothetical protein [Burkholderia ubonensis]AOJ76133.1 hypothetical protein WJ35_14410 [Burkholderia ubonensis]AOK59911.1 hypothetical protein WM29_12780 [Burkholderia ubonensis]KVS48250.1 hypothetical protein WK37_07825 [Burkholderia ubonensis]KVS49227.1 hypothetical protein WK38_17960 [Burkholderia ubonensis]KVS70414.1 hypothetical protein WK42_27470 [Burkholderia ubonensis]